MHIVHHLIGWYLTITAEPPRRDERGLSQSTENAILVAGAAVIALAIVTFVTIYVNDHLPKK